MVSPLQGQAMLGDPAWARSAFHRIGKRKGASVKGEEGTENWHGALSVFVLRKITFRKENLWHLKILKSTPPGPPESLRESFCIHAPT